MSEVDGNGRVLCSLTDVRLPRHLSSDSDGHVLVADCNNDRVLLLSSELQVLEHVLINTDSPVKLKSPTRLCYNELALQLYILHCSSEQSSRRDVVSLFKLTRAKLKN